MRPLELLVLLRDIVEVLKGQAMQVEDIERRIDEKIEQYSGYQGGCGR